MSYRDSRPSAGYAIYGGPELHGRRGASRVSDALARDAAMALPGRQGKLRLDAVAAKPRPRGRLHRLEACKQLGEETIVGYVVQVRQH
jgi:hypothetical protein